MTTNGLAITTQEVLEDLEVGRSRPLVLPAHEDDAPDRPALGGRAFRATWLAAQVVGRVSPVLAAGLMERLWFTPWAVGRERDLPDSAVRRTFSRVGAPALSGWSAGVGPTVLLVHGWGGRSTDLAALGEALAHAGRHVVAVDLPGHGRSPGVTTNLYEMAAALRSVADQVGPVDAVVAHSLGSGAAVRAIEEGLVTDRLVLLAPPDRMADAIDRFGVTARFPERVIAQLVQRIEDRFGPRVWDELTVAGGAARIEVDALVVHDVDDREIPQADSRAVAEALGVGLLVTSGLGHGRILVDPDVTRTVVAKVVG